MKLSEDQLEALGKMTNGCILNGGTGSGKSITALSYYYMLPQNDGCYEGLRGGEINMSQWPLDLYIITTARKRDTKDWELEMAPFGLSTDEEFNGYLNKVVVDSWNNIKKYTDVKDAFFIFDEQRVIGDGKWVKSFYKITDKNQWILLSATPGDRWVDYAPVFIANGFYKNITDFRMQHCIYKRFSKYPVITGYYNEGRLMKYRRMLLVDIDYKRPTVQHHIDIWCQYDIKQYKKVMRERFNYEKNEPYKSASELCLGLRKVVNSDQSRIDIYKQLCHENRKVIVFYNYNYELDILRKVRYDNGTVVAEWNGHKHDPIPDGGRWVYLVQYTAGAEGWNCIETNIMIFFSMTYSYKQLVQSCGRIDRRNTEYKDLFYYHLKSHAPIDIAIANALKNKKKFNELDFITL